jgi:hypothetical protein
MSMLTDPRVRRADVLAAVANAFVVTFEEYPPQNDQNDYVLILRNVITSTSRPVLGLETDVRHDLYERLQQLPMAFHGYWQSGQLLSRVTTDLSSIRRFAGFGLLFLIINITQLTVVTAVLLNMYWPLGLRSRPRPADHLPVDAVQKAASSSPPRPGRAGDLATLAEEGAVGIRVIKSRALRHVSASTTAPPASSTTPRWTRSACPRGSGLPEVIRTSPWSSYSHRGPGRRPRLSPHLVAFILPLPPFGRSPRSA